MKYATLVDKKFSLRKKSLEAGTVRYDLRESFCLPGV